MASNLENQTFFQTAIALHWLAGEVAGKGAIRFTAFEQLGGPRPVGLTWNWNLDVFFLHSGNLT